MVDMQPWFVLPKSLRTKEVSWDREFLIGRYTATVQLNRGYDDIVDEVVFSFWVFPWKIMSLAFAGVFIFFLVLRFLFTRFEFKRKN
jgi:pilus assembly protein TadC